MKCPKCNKNVDKSFKFCPHCGSILNIPDGVPKPRRLKNGTFYGQLMVNGERISIKESSLDAYYAAVFAFKSGIIKTEKQEVGETILLSDVIDKYIDSQRNIRSASYIRSMDTISRTRFQDAMDCDVRVIDWQKLINREALLVKPKTVRNNWSLIKKALEFSGFDVPKVNLPKLEPVHHRFLDADGIKKLLTAMKGNKYELATILALHGLRASEFLALEASDIYDGHIHVNKALVRDTYGQQVIQHRNKNKTSSRDVPVLIPRLYDLLPEEGGRLVPYTEIAIYNAIQRMCVKLGLPPCGVHDMRRSFASLCYFKGLDEKYVMRIGGWSSPNVLREVYIHLYDKKYKENTDVLKDFFQNY